MAINYDHQRDRIASTSGVLTVSTTGALGIPVGNTGQRPDNATGLIRFNTQTASFEGYNGTSWGQLGGISDVVDDTTPQLGGNLDVNNKSIVSTSNGNIILQPDGAGKVSISGINYPTTDGTNGQILTTDGSGNLSFITSYTDANVDTHLNQNTAATGEVLSWNGTDYDWVSNAGYTDTDVDAHLNLNTATTGQALVYDGTDYSWGTVGGAVTIQDEGTNLTTSATTINFVGSGVTASGVGATKTITITGGGGGGGISLADLSVGAEATPSGNGDIAYNNATGVFTYTPPILSGITGDTNDITEGSTNLYYTTTRANTDFDTRLASKSTTNLTEGTNLYYTTARTNTDFDTRLGTKDTDDLAEGTTNLYYTDARVQAASINNVVEDTTPQLGGNLDLNSKNITGTGDINITGNVTVSGYLAGPANFVIDPAGVGDNTGKVVIAGDLQVDGTQTTINSTTLDVDDINITVAKGAVNSSLANGGGLIVDGANATFTYTNADNRWNLNKELNVARVHGNVTGNVTGQVSDISNHDTNALSEGSTNLYFTNARADGRIALQVGANLDLSNKSTTDLAEGTNLYYTDARTLSKINVSSINELSDVDTATNPPTDGQVLQYSATNSEWIPGTASGGGGSSLFQLLNL